MGGRSCCPEPAKNATDLQRGGCVFSQTPPSWRYLTAGARFIRMNLNSLDHRHPTLLTPTDSFGQNQEAC